MVFPILAPKYLAHLVANFEVANPLENLIS